MQLTMTKVHGSGSDFFLLDENKLTERLTKEVASELSQVICQREKGLLGGAEGLIIVSSPATEETKAAVHVLTNEGKEDNLSGNGLRVAARLIAEREGEREFLVQTMHKDLKVRQWTHDNAELPIMQVEIAPVSFQASAVPLNLPADDTIINQKIESLSKDLRFTVVAAPHPHLIAFVERELLESDELARIAELANDNHPLFPVGISVSFVEILATDELYVRTYKKDLGLTNSCGTAIAASSLLYSLLERREFGKKIIVNTAGGLARTIVHQDPDGTYWMELIGNATFTHQIEISLADALARNFNRAKINETKEEVIYQDFLKNN